MTISSYARDRRDREETERSVLPITEGTRKGIVWQSVGRTRAHRRERRRGGRRDDLNQHHRQMRYLMFMGIKEDL